MQKKWYAVLLALLILLGLGSAFAQTELLDNGSFEELDSDGLPLGWYTDAYRTQEGFTLYSSVEDSDAPDGTHYVTIESMTENDARFAQDVEVEPESLYRLSGWVRADDVPDSGRGANLSIGGLYVFSESVYSDDGEWQYIEMYGETGLDQTTLTVFVRLGGYGGESEGKASFDAISLVEVDEVPGSGVASLWFSQPASDDDIFFDEDEEDTVTGPAWPWLLVIAFVWLVAIALTLNEYSQVPDLAPASKRGLPAAMWIGLLLAFATRVLLSMFVRGYDVDVNCFTAWGATMRSVGASGFYTTTGFCDYPPAYLWVLWLCSAVSSLFGSAEMVRLVFRMVPVLCDIGAAVALYVFATKRGANRKVASILSLSLAFSPALILNSACWGQMDSVLCVCLMAIAWLAMERKWMPLMPLYMLAVLIKPQALMLGPLGLIAIIQTAIRHREDIKPMLIGVGLALLTALAIILPFSFGQEPFWIFELYGRTLSSYAYATVNTANFYYLLNGNWSPIASQAHILAPLVFSFGCAVYAFLLWRSGKQRAYSWAEPVLLLLCAGAFLVMAMVGVSWSVVGTLAMAVAFIIVIPLYLRGGDAKNLPLLGGLLFILLYVLGIKMHERYLFPAFFLLAMACAVHRDWRLPVLLAVVTATLFVNEGIVLDNSIRLGSSYGHLNHDTNTLADLISAVNVAAVPFAIWTAYELILKQKIRSLPTLKLREVKAEARRPSTFDPSLHWTRRDTVLMLAVTLIYAVVAFTNLGSTKAPQTSWKSTAKTESVVFDLGEHPETYSILYFAQVSYSDFSLQFSDAGENWDDRYWAQMDQGECFRWKYVVPYSDGTTRTYYSYGDAAEFNARYVRLNAEQVGLILNEIIFRTPDGEVLPVTILSREGENSESPLYSSPEALLDEQDTLEGEPGWFTGTYFDEIYHARTAYEHLHGSSPYETTHPPLGKLLMSLCVAIFGMTPFGWRFAGALAGVLMLPVLYLTGKQLTKLTLPAFIVMTLMALDCMHFTQTRIATIDSFPVLFIITAFFFMLRFMQRDILHTPLRKLLPDLAFSGFFMGCSIASKWIGCYAGCGLAVLFFWTCARHGRIAARLGEGKAALRRILIICVWCVLFFVLVPVIIYLLCYIPYFAFAHITSPADFIKRVISAQEGMLNYHSTPGLGMDHPFYSPWYEWPLIQRPMYYAMASHVPEGYSYAIFCFGNPAVWYTGLVAIILAALWWMQHHLYRIDGKAALVHWTSSTPDQSAAFVLIGFLAQFLPWVLVPRGTYIYHYFASVPFLCLAVALLMDRLMQHRPKLGKMLTVVLLLMSLLFFIGFYPYASGCLAPTGWLDFMKNFLHVYY